MKKITLSLLCLLILFTLTACTGIDSYFVQDNFFEYTYGIGRKEAHLGYIKFNSDIDCELNITVPDVINGVPVTKLGGYYGSGVPNRFRILTTIGQSTKFEDPYQYDESFKTSELVFTIHLGKNINEPYFGFNSGVYGSVNDSDKIVYKIMYYFVCDEENKTFYATEGKLYYKSNNQEAKFPED